MEKHKIGTLLSKGELEIAGEKSSSNDEKLCRVQVHYSFVFIFIHLFIVNPSVRNSISQSLLLAD
jgi:hypothetical protein